MLVSLCAAPVERIGGKVWCCSLAIRAWQSLEIERALVMTIPLKMLLHGIGRFALFSFVDRPVFCHCLTLLP